MTCSGLLCPSSLSLATCPGKVWASLGEATMDDPRLSGLICRGGKAHHGQTMLLLVVAELRRASVTHSTAKPHVSSMAVSSLSYSLS